MNNNKNINNILSDKQKNILSRVVYLAKSEDLSGAVKTLYSYGICPLSNKIKKQLINKHPFEPEYKKMKMIIIIMILIKN